MVAWEHGTECKVLACMGPPANKAAEGATEVWSYSSGNGQVNGAFGNGFARSNRLFCTVNVTMQGGAVTRVVYLGPTGNLLTAGEQCAYAVAACGRDPTVTSIGRP
jgi:hypothetical protein